MPVPAHLPREENNKLLEILKKDSRFNFRDFALEEHPQLTGSIEYYLFRKSDKGKFYFQFYESDSHIVYEYTPGTSAPTYRNQSKKIGEGRNREKAYDQLQLQFKKWLDSMSKDEQSLKDQEALKFEMEGVEVIEEAELEKPFTNRQKALYHETLDEFIFKVQLSNRLVDNQKTILVSVAEQTKHKLDEAKTVEDEVPDEQKFSKNSIIVPFKVVVNKIIHWVKKNNKKAVEELGKDLFKWGYRFTGIGALSVLGFNIFSSEQKMEVYNIYISSNHYFLNPEFPLPIARKANGALEEFFYELPEQPISNITPPLLPPTLEKASKSI
jgi:hypothetical protein